MSLECCICPTNTFYEHFSLLADHHGRISVPVNALIQAMQKLKDYAWDGSLPISPYGSGGDSFAFRFHPGYMFTFQRYTERDSHKQPVRIKLFLKTIQRVP